MRKRTEAIAAITLASILCLGADGQTSTSRAERELFASINQARRANGLPPLRWDESLAIAARRHAEVMGDHRSAQHGFGGEPGLSARAKLAGAHFIWLSENVIEGPSPVFIHAEFMNSPSLRANILDRDMDSIGVGAVERGGEIFAVEDFSKAR